MLVARLFGEEETKLTLGVLRVGADMFGAGSHVGLTPS